MFCDQVKEYLSQKGVKFREKDVTQDSNALAELEKIGYMTTPVTIIGDVVIVGFDTAKTDAALSG